MKHVMLTLNRIRFHNPGGSRLNNFKLALLQSFVLRGSRWRKWALKDDDECRRYVTAVMNHTFPSGTLLK